MSVNFSYSELESWRISKVAVDGASSLWVPRDSALVSTELQTAEVLHQVKSPFFLNVPQK